MLIGWMKSDVPLSILPFDIVAQVGTSQLGLRFFVANFTADTFKLLAGKGSSTKLTLNSASNSTTGFLNRQVRRLPLRDFATGFFNHQVQHRQHQLGPPGHILLTRVRMFPC